MSKNVRLNGTQYAVRFFWLKNPFDKVLINFKGLLFQIQLNFPSNGIFSRRSCNSSIRLTTAKTKKKKKKFESSALPRLFWEPKNLEQRIRFKGKVVNGAISVNDSQLLVRNFL